MRFLTWLALLGLTATPALPEAARADLSSPAQSVAFAPDGRLVVGTKAEVALHDPQTLTRLRALPGSEGGGWGATFSRGGALAVAGMAQDVLVWDDLGRPPRRYPSQAGRVFGLAWSPAGDRLAFGDSGGHWRVEPDGPRGRLAGDVMAITWSLDARTLYLSTGQEDSAVYALDARTGRRLWRQQNVPREYVRRAYYGLDEVNGLTLSPDGARLACAHQDGRVLLRDVVTGRLLRDLRGVSDTRWSAFTPDGQRLVAVGEQGEVAVWDVTRGAPLARAKTGHGPLWWVAVSPDGRRALTAGDDRTVRAWALP